MMCEDYYPIIEKNWKRFSKDRPLFQLLSIQKNIEKDLKKLAIVRDDPKKEVLELRSVPHYKKNWIQMMILIS